MSWYLKVNNRYTSKIWKVGTNLVMHTSNHSDSGNQFSSEVSTAKAALNLTSNLVRIFHSWLVICIHSGNVGMVEKPKYISNWKVMFGALKSHHFCPMLSDFSSPLSLFIIINGSTLRVKVYNPYTKSVKLHRCAWCMKCLLITTKWPMPQSSQH